MADEQGTQQLSTDTQATPAPVDTGWMDEAPTMDSIESDAPETPEVTDTNESEPTTTATVTDDADEASPSPAEEAGDAKDGGAEPPPATPDHEPRGFDKKLQKVTQDLGVTQRQNKELQDLVAELKQSIEQMRSESSRQAIPPEQPEPDAPEPIDPLDGLLDDDDDLVTGAMLKKVLAAQNGGTPAQVKALADELGVTRQQVQQMLGERQARSEYQSAMDKAREKFGVSDPETVWNETWASVKGDFPDVDDQQLVIAATREWEQKLGQMKATADQTKAKAATPAAPAKKTPPARTTPPQSTEGTEAIATGASSRSGASDDGWVDSEAQLLASYQH
jgi:hypothetical protein